MTLTSYRQARRDRFHEKAAKAGWHFYTITIDEKHFEVHLTGFPLLKDTTVSKYFLLENFALNSNLGVYRPAEKVLEGKDNVFTAHDLPQSV